MKVKRTPRFLKAMHNLFLKLLGLGLFFLIPCAQAKQKAEVPLNIGFGPELNSYNGLIGKDQFFHYGIKLDVHAFIDKKVIRKNRKKIPKNIRDQVLKLKAVRVGKIYIPESIILSPKIRNTGIYGLNFRPLSLGLPLLSGALADVRLSTGLNLTYLLIHSDSLFVEEGNDVMHFLRPGLSAKLNLQLKPSEGFQISTGLEGTAYVPQEVSSDSRILTIGEFNRESLWNQWQIYGLLNFRFPMKMGL